jgi:hypothetical protein
LAYRCGLAVCETSTVIGVSVISVAVVASLVAAIVVVLAFALITRWVGKPSIAVTIALAVLGAVVMVFPFGLNTFRNGTYYDGIPNRCKPPIVSAWSEETSDGFPLPQGFPSCVDPARRRLALGSVLIAGGAVIVIVSRRRSARGSASVIPA